MSGGEVDTGLQVREDGRVNFVGLRFVLDGNDITSTLPLNTPVEVSARNVSLTGNLSDRTAFEFDLNDTNASNADYFVAEATLTITLVLPGDYNGDGVVDAADYTVWRDTLGDEGEGLAADGNFDRIVDEFDYEIWTQWYGETGRSSVQSVPEPASILIVAAVCLVGRRGGVT